MHFGEAIVLKTTKRPGGAQEVALQAVCRGANYERLNVIVGACRVAVPLDRPERGASREFKVSVQEDVRLSRGDKVPVEFFFPGEQAGARCAGNPFPRLNPKPTTLRHPYVWKAI